MTAVLARQARPTAEQLSATAEHGMVSTSHPAATEAGVGALSQGGSAVDAYLAAAAVQVVVEPTMTSLAGTMLMSVLDPATGRSALVSDMGALPEAEDARLDDDGRWSGRTVMRPGWVRAAHRAWERWGRLPWSDLFAPAITAARDGFEVDALLWAWIFESRMVAGRGPLGRAQWYPEGQLPAPGDTLRLPQLARTLQHLSEEGPGYIYEGDFARRYVEAARAAGGRLTLDDMARGDVNEVDLTPFPVADGSEIHTCGPLFALLLNMVAVSGVAERDLQDPRALYSMLRIVEEAWHHGLELSGPEFRLPSGDEMADVVSIDVAERLWRRAATESPRPFDSMNMGTCAISVVDRDGMVAHGTHSSTSTPFGVGLLVDGVVVPRIATVFAQPLVPMPLGWATSLVAVRDGVPVLAAASPSISALQNVFQNSVNVLLRGMPLADSVQQPMFGAAVHPSRRPMLEATMGEAAFDHLSARGLAVDRVSPWEPEIGSCQAVAVGADGLRRGVADPRRLGRAAGH